MTAAAPRTCRDCPDAWVTGRSRLCDDCRQKALEARKARRRQRSLQRQAGPATQSPDPLESPRTLGAVAAAVRSGDQRTSLEAIRDQLARALDECRTSETGSLSRQLTSVLAALASLPSAAAAEDTVDELARKRAERLSAAAH